jgi:hypothetical protein
MVNVHQGGHAWVRPRTMPPTPHGVPLAEHWPGRAKVSSKPWEGVKTHEISCCYPVVIPAPMTKSRGHIAQHT